MSSYIAESHCSGNVNDPLSEEYCMACSSLTEECSPLQNDASLGAICEITISLSHVVQCLVIISSMKNR